VFSATGSLVDSEGDFSVGVPTRRLGIGVASTGIARIYTKGGLAKLVLGSDDTDILTVDSTNRVGIGTSNPHANLHVFGTVQDIVGTEGSFSIGTSVRRLAIGVTSAGITRIYAKGGQAKIFLGSDDSDVITIDSSNRVGIGIDSPVSRLHVNGGQGDLSVSEGDVCIGSPIRHLGIGIDIPNGITRIYAKGGRARLVLGSDDTDVMVIDSANRVGIGDLPLNRLDVRSDGIDGSSTTVVGLISNISGRPALQFSSGTSATPGSGMAIEYVGIGANATRRMNIRGTDQLPKVSFTNGGSVGIGTESPNETLEIAGTVFIGDGGGNNRKGLLIDSYGGATDYVKLQPYDYGADTELDLVITGNVGIGNSPTEKLSVTGSICYTGSIGACSDARYKTQIAPLQGALQRCLALKPSTYYWKIADFPEKEFTDARQMGLIAQDVQEVFPDIVQTASDGYLSIDYAKLSVALLGALQEQQHIIDQQHEKLLSLEKKIDQVERTLDR
jgi:hypothetical protein